MRRAGALVLAVLLCGSAGAWVDSFDVRSVYEQQLVSHQRLRFTVDTGGALFPYSGQVGWRLLFSRYEIGASDPQYEYAVWALPAQAADLSQEIWIVRPEGLTGEWHYRIDAVDESRAPLATSGEIVYTFGQEATVYTDTIPYAASSPYWSTSIAITNTSDEATTVRLEVYDDTGDPYPILDGRNAMEVQIPPRGVYTSYLARIVGLRPYTGSIRLTAPVRCRWLAIAADGQGTSYNYSGRLEK